MDIVEQLRAKADIKSPNDFVKQRRIETQAADEIERLRQQNAELVEALKFYACNCQCLDGCSIADCGDVARKTLAKARRKVMDIVERLRRYRPTYGWPEERSVIVEPTLTHVAADEIERLREVIENMTNLSNDMWNVGFTALKGDE